MTGALAGRRVVVPESRELDLFCSMLEREGAETLRCPLVTILDVSDPAPVEAWLRRLAEGAFDDLVLYTGEGVKRLVAAAERIELREAAIAALARARTIVRGPKPMRVLRTLGLSPSLQAEPATTEGLIATISDLDLTGRTIGIQAYPDLPEAIDRALLARGARVERVLPYRYADDREDTRVAEVIDLMVAGEVDLVAFTSRPQVERLRDVAGRTGKTAALDRAMGTLLLAAVGPVTADAVRAAGWDVAVAPDSNFHLKPFIRAMNGLFAGEVNRG